jgi:hypothetical protein
VFRTFAAIFTKLFQSEFSFLLFASVEIIISVFANAASHGYNHSFCHLIYFSLKLKPAEVKNIGKKIKPF